jgi:uncharacterized protein (TIGR00730 family)
MLRSLAVFCASHPGARPLYEAAAREVGATLARTGRRVVYGGARSGLMGALAEGVLAAGGEIIGVMPRHMVDREIAHSGLTRLEIVHSMHERKSRMADLADGFIALPGGLGTLEEFIEVWTWGQLGLHRKPYGLLNVAGYYDPFLAFLDHAVGERFVRPDHRALVQVSSEIAPLLGAMDATPPEPLPRWLDRATR